RQESGTHTVAESDAAELVEQARMEGKALDPTLDPDAAADYDPGEDQAAAAELAVAALLTALLARQEGVVTARLESPKTRKGTPFWQVEDADDTRGGDEPLPAEKIVDAERWGDEAAKVLEPVVGKAA